MNRISLYEALRRKKDAEGLNMAPQGQPVPKQAPRTEPKIQLKQPPKQAAPVVPEKKSLKSPIKLMLTKKTALFRQQTAYQQAWDWLKKVVQSNPRLAGQIGITTGIIVVVILLVFWLRGFGQKDQVQPVGRTTVKNVENRAAENKPIVRQTPAAPAATQQKEKPTAQQQSGASAKSQLPPVIQSRLEQKPPAETKPQEQAKPAKPVGDHIIVIVAYTKQEDLTPVMAYFKKNGVETEVVKQGSYYLLVTKDRFESPERSGTDGYKMKQTIKRLGANYKAPDGYERFSSTPFQDVYGKKVK